MSFIIVFPGTISIIYLCLKFKQIYQIVDTLLIQVSTTYKDMSSQYSLSLGVEAGVICCEYMCMLVLRTEPLTFLIIMSSQPL